MSSAEDLVEQLGSDVARGLDVDEAARRLEEHGPNELPAEAGTSPWTILLAQLKNVLVIILVVAIVLSSALGHALEAVAIAVIALFSVVLGFVQEFRAEKAMEALRRLASPDATVVRGGAAMDIPARDVVPGDIILLGAGDLVPADARLVQTADLRVDEAALTGESSPVAKSLDAPDDPAVAIGDRRNMVWSSTAVTNGRARALVVATAGATEVGKIGALLSSVDTHATPLEDNLARVGRALARAAGVVVLLVVGLGFVHGRPFFDMVVFGIALAVAVVPEALPAVVTISLALGARRMVRRNALVRRLPVVETLGSTTVICSDKTGTLTTGEMTVREAYVATGKVEVSGVGYEPSGALTRDGADCSADAPLRALLRAAALSTDAHLVQEEGSGRWRVKGDPTEGALVVAAAKAGLDKPALEAESPRLAEIPFSSETKRMITLHRGAEGREVIAKGAPEVILASCSRIAGAQGDEPLGAARSEAVLAVAREMASRALRVLAVASRPAGRLEDAHQDLTFLGLVGMMDPPRAEAKAAIDTCFAAGIRPIMITGDHPVTARAVAAELGLLRAGGVVTGVELDRLDDDALAARQPDIDVYARVSPAHKLRIVDALQRQGEVVAMTGDGVNDAPALRKADIGIAMGITGTDVAKGAAAMILTDDNFASIVAAVEEGRGIFENIKKYLMYLLSSNIGEILLMAAAVALGLPLPLTAVQILYVNLATDGLPALALAVDPQGDDMMRRDPRRKGRTLMTRPMVVLMLLGGAWSAIVNLGLFAWTLNSGRPAAEAVTMTFVSLVLIQFLKAYSFRSDRQSVLRRPFRNPWLNAAILWELALLAAIVFVPALHAPFGTYSLTATDLAIVAGLALTVVPVLELGKWMARRGRLGTLG
ncbi:MAG TPA: cation-translocating P-type ATPase [Kofleriaceae bacterium]|nr:cation-translocating P-type ATPase [Kofleriaceae bacterium]